MLVKGDRAVAVESAFITSKKMGTILTCWILEAITGPVYET